MDFLFHKVSEEEKEKIKKEAKSIMDSFSEKLNKIDSKKLEDPLIEREDFERNEGEGKEEDKDFRERMFDNTPNKNKDFIIAEKKGW